ncbi:hypothetical protein IFR05_000281 [Cadophora sp. M221]|nr:hypothetical protein IFR05_000281 [Cadophora sp. M221]
MPRKLRRGSVRRTPAPPAPSAPHRPDLLAIPAVVFPGYPKLPLELRTMIIELAIETRTVKTSHAGSPKQAMIASPLYYFCSQVTTYTPAILHVNKDVREIALKSYKLHTPTDLATPFYFHPTADTIFLTSNGILWDVMTWPEAPTTMGIQKLRICLNNAPDLAFVKKLSQEDPRRMEWNRITGIICSLRGAPCIAVIKLVQKLRETLELVIVDSEFEKFRSAVRHIKEGPEGIVPVRFPYWDGEENE